MAHSDVRYTVRDFIQKNFVFDDAKPIDGQTSLLGSGIIDSTGILELIGFLEARYTVKFRDSELVGENFDSIDKISAFLGAKLNGRE